MVFIISMGIPAKNYRKLKEGFRYDGAVIHVIDWKRKRVIKEITYKSPPEHLGRGMSMQFKGASIYNGEKYYVVTNTEVLCYDICGWKLVDVYSQRDFNDLHSVLRVKDKIYVCNTGLEIVQVFSSDWMLLDEINLCSVPTWDRFDRFKDYRRVPTTKPHEVHVNHLFVLGGHVFATRGQKQDVVDLLDMSTKIQLSKEQDHKNIILCHDGLVKGDRIFFTQVDGRILEVERGNLNNVSVLDLNSLNSTRKKLGWVRGLEVVDDFAFVGTSKMRGSRFKEYTEWAVKGSRKAMPSSIIQVDLRRKRIVDYYELERYKGHAIYTILQHPCSY